MAGAPHLSVSRVSTSSTSELSSFTHSAQLPQECGTRIGPLLECVHGGAGGAGLLFDPPQSLALILFLTQLGFVSKV